MDFIKSIEYGILTTLLLLLNGLSTKKFIRDFPGYALTSTGLGVLGSSICMPQYKTFSYLQ